jgi:hypothetical protein
VIALGLAVIHATGLYGQLVAAHVGERGAAAALAGERQREASTLADRKGVARQGRQIETETASIRYVAEPAAPTGSGLSDG